jgi:hypothetical protein
MIHYQMVSCVNRHSPIYQHHCQYQRMVHPLNIGYFIGMAVIELVNSFANQTLVNDWCNRAIYCVWSLTIPHLRYHFLFWVPMFEQLKIVAVLWVTLLPSLGCHTHMIRCDIIIYIIVACTTYPWCFPLI